jgi:hypothetical protein
MAHRAPQVGDTGVIRDRDFVSFVVTRILDNGDIIIKDTENPKRHAMRVSVCTLFDGTAATIMDGLPA